MSEVLESIRRAIKTSGKSSYQIAQESGVAPSQLSRMLSGERGVSVQTLERLAKALGLEIVVRPRQTKKGS